MRRRLPNSPAVGDDEKHIDVRLGWVAGAGIEYAFAPHWTARLEYLYSQYDRANVRFPSGTQFSSTTDFQQIRIGLNRKVDWPGSPGWTPKTEIDGHRIQPLGNSRPDHLHRSGLSVVSRAL